MRQIAPLIALLSLAACSSGTQSSGGPGGPGGVRRAGIPDSVVPAAPNTTAHADLRDVEGRSLGTLTLTQMPRGVLVSGDLTSIPPGAHALHIHDAGRCEPPFTTAGGHFNPTLRAHGFKSPNGNHGGDMPNFVAAAAGTAHVEYYSREVTLGPGMTSLFDTDGASLVVHAGPDDYQSDPAGNSGPRIGCGVIMR